MYISAWCCLYADKCTLCIYAYMHVYIDSACLYRADQKAKINKSLVGNCNVAQCKSEESGVVDEDMQNDEEEQIDTEVEKFSVDEERGTEIRLKKRRCLLFNLHRPHHRHHHHRHHHHHHHHYHHHHQILFHLVIDGYASPVADPGFWIRGGQI